MAVYREAESAQYGRHLVADTSIKSGSVVLTQQPYAAVLYDSQVPLRCDWCFKTATEAGTILKRCAHSKFAYYCSRDHQKTAWRAYYKQECAALVACAPRVPPATVRLAARVMWRRERELHAGHSQHEDGQQQQQSVGERLQQQLGGGTFNDVEALLSHWQELDDGRKLQYAQMAALTREYIQGTLQQQRQLADDTQPLLEQQQPASADAADVATGMPVRQIALLLARFACNNHTVCDDELRPIGVGIYPLAALVNHACRPNCVQTFAGSSIVFRSLGSIPEGQQLTISYVELAATRQERRRQLLEQYFFDIDAATCEPASQDQQQKAADSASATQRTTQPGSTDTQDSGLHSLQVLVQLPALPLPGGQQYSQQLPLWSSMAGCDVQLSSISPGNARSTGDSNSNSSSNSSSNRVCKGRPPWREDAPDKQLCQVLLRWPAAAAPSQQQQVQLPGGLCLLPQLLPPPVSSAGQHTAPAAPSAALCSLFQELDSLEHAQHRVGADMQQQPGAAAQPQPPQLEAAQWGDWQQVLQDIGADSSSECRQQQVTGHVLAEAGAGLLLQVWRLQQQAEAMAHQGDAAAATRLCEAALAAADGAGPSPNGQGVGVSAADDGGCQGGAAGLNQGSSSNMDCSGVVRLMLGPQHILRIRVLGSLLVAAVSAAEWRTALVTARQLVPLYELVYPQVWPNLGLHYALLAKLEVFMMEQPAAAVKAAEAAAAILRITHGGGAAVLHEVCKTLYEAQQELAAAQMAD